MRFSPQQLERAQSENICPAILLEDPQCAIVYPDDMPASDDALFFLHFESDKPRGFTNKGSSMRLQYVRVCEEAFCWLLSAKTSNGETPLLKSDPTAGWPVDFYGGSPIGQWWTMDAVKLEQVKFSQHWNKGTPHTAGSVDNIMVHLSRAECRQDAVMRRSEALVHKASQQMVAKMDGVTDVLMHIAENAQQTALKVHEIERQQKDVNDIIADLQQQVSELQRASSSQPEPRQSTAPLTPDGPAPSTSVTIDGHEVNIDELESPMAVRWWQSKQRYADVWLPPQRAVYDVDKQSFTVDLQSRWCATEPEHRGVCLRYLSFCKRQHKNGDDRKRRRRW